MIKKDQVDTIKELFEQGWTPKRIAIQLNVKVNVVRRVGYKYECILTKRELKIERKEFFEQILHDTDTMSYNELCENYGTKTLRVLSGIFKTPIKRIYTERKRQQILALLDKGIKPKTIIKVMDISKETISETKRIEGIQRRRLDKEAMLKRDKALLKDYAKGMPTEKIREKYKLKNIGMVLKNYPNQTRRPTARKPMGPYKKKNS